MEVKMRVKQSKELSLHKRYNEIRIVLEGNMINKHIT